jgi:hypothetical protein
MSGKNTKKVSTEDIKASVIQSPDIPGRIFGEEKEKFWALGRYRF